MKVEIIMVDSALWERVQSVARREGLRAGDVLAAAVDEYIARRSRKEGANAVESGDGVVEKRGGEQDPRG